MCVWYASWFCGNILVFSRQGEKQGRPMGVLEKLLDYHLTFTDVAFDHKE